MSYYKKLRNDFKFEKDILSLEHMLDGGINVPDLSLEDFHVSNIARNVFGKIRDIYVKVKEFIINLFKKVKSFFSNLLSKNSDRIERNIKRLEEIKKADFVDDKDLVREIHKYLGANSVKTGSALFFTTSGDLIDCNVLLANIDKILKKDFNDSIFNDYDTLESEITINTKANIFSLKFKITYDDLVNHPNFKNETFKKIETFYSEKDRLFRSELNELEKELNDKIKNNNADDTKELSKRVTNLRNISKLITLPMNVVIGQIRLVESVVKAFSSEEYTTTTKQPFSGKLYHLNGNSMLTEFKPRYGGSNHGEFLPPRISFGAEILGCCVAIPRYFLPGFENGVEKSTGLFYRDLYCYEGIVEPGKTKFVLPQLVEYHLPLNLQHIVKEICVTTPIKVKKIGKVRIYYKNPNKLDKNLLNFFKFMKDKEIQGNFNRELFKQGFYVRYEML